MHFHDSGVDDPLRAWRCSPVVAVRFQSHIKNRSSGSVTSVLERNDLGVGLPWRLGPAFAHDLAISYHHRPHRRVGAGGAHGSASHF
jgi:hypothetical protein